MYLLHLPRHILLQILHQVDVGTLFISCTNVCRHFRELLEQQTFLQSYTLLHYDCNFDRLPPITPAYQILLDSLPCLQGSFNLGSPSKSITSWPVAKIYAFDLRLSLWPACVNTLNVPLSDAIANQSALLPIQKQPIRTILQRLILAFPRINDILICCATGEHCGVHYCENPNLDVSKASLARDPVLWQWFIDYRLEPIERYRTDLNSLCQRAERLLSIQLCSDLCLILVCYTATWQVILVQARAGSFEQPFPLELPDFWKVSDELFFTASPETLQAALSAVMRIFLEASNFYFADLTNYNIWHATTPFRTFGFPFNQYEVQQYKMVALLNENLQYASDYVAKASKSPFPRDPEACYRFLLSRLASVCLNPLQLLDDRETFLILCQLFWSSASRKLDVSPAVRDQINGSQILTGFKQLFQPTTYRNQTVVNACKEAGCIQFRIKDFDRLRDQVIRELYPRNERSPNDNRQSRPPFSTVLTLWPVHSLVQALRGLPDEVKLLLAEEN